MTKQRAIKIIEDYLAQHHQEPIEDVIIATSFDEKTNSWLEWSYYSLCLYVDALNKEDGL